MRGGKKGWLLPKLPVQTRVNPFRRPSRGWSAPRGDVIFSRGQRPRPFLPISRIDRARARPAPDAPQKSSVPKFLPPAFRSPSRRAPAFGPRRLGLFSFSFSLSISLPFSPAALHADSDSRGRSFSIAAPGALGRSVARARSVRKRHRLPEVHARSRRPDRFHLSVISRKGV